MRLHDLHVPGTLLLTLVPLVLAAPARAQDPDPTPAPDHRALWQSGRTYDAFYADAFDRRSLWDRNTAGAEVPDALLDRARAVPGPWRLLVVAFDRCSDSVQTLPYIQALVERVDGLDMRIVPPDLGRPIMEAHRTPDGRAATPTVLLLDPSWEPRGAWVERPSELQRWFIENPEGLSHDAKHYRKMDWYDEDAGRSTIREVVELLEATALERDADA